MELKFYELIGIRQWKKFVLWLSARFIYTNPCYRRGGNYYLASLDIASLKEFRKALLFNGIIHFCGVVIGINFFISVALDKFNNSKFIFVILVILNIVAFFINLYCVLLQRYNWLRIKKVLKSVKK